MKYLAFSMFFTVFMLQGCSSFQNFNETVSGNVSFKGGRFEEFSWEDEMNFHRTSFYKGATMAYDVLLHRLDRNSPFAKWFDSSEKEYLKKCHKLLIGIFYAESMQPTSVAYLSKEIEKQNFKEIIVPGFNQHIKNHPSYQQYFLFSHKVIAFCGEDIIGREKPITMALPGFNKLKVLK